MTRFSIYQLMRLMPNADQTPMRIWENDEEVFDGMVSECPKEYLHRSIPEMSVGHWTLIIYL